MEIDQITRIPFNDHSFKRKIVTGVLKMDEKSEKTSPSTFMRQLRPEYYSDTFTETEYLLDKPTLEYYLSTITSRNQMHDFEIFCRKLCERKICPNLKPATGPEGGGDSKADTETIPISEEIASLAYIGETTAAKERWAFAFSAKKTWAAKARSDVEGIVATNRDYKKIFCVTSQFARAKDRSKLEDNLSKQYAINVTVLDRVWIVEQVIDNDCKDLAFNYLGIGQESALKHRLGPSDYSRERQLTEIEKSLSDPNAYAGMEMQRAKEALIAAKLSRNLERPRTEIDGRFIRAVRLAEKYGTNRQQLETRYEYIWTSFWWFDDIAALNNGYSEFEKLVIENHHAFNLELLCNLAQLLINSIVHQYLTVEQAQLTPRLQRLIDRLSAFASDMERPNNALEARTSLLIINVNQALLNADVLALETLWTQFSEILKLARGLGEFSADRLTQMIEAFGVTAGDSSTYSKLVDDMAEFTAERTGEAQGALVLLKRARQLEIDSHLEIIRLLGKAAWSLTKKEYAEPLIEALQLLSVAYRAAGMLWAARASCTFAIATIVIEGEEQQEMPVSIVPTVLMLAWIALELRHLPDVLDAVRLVRRCESLPLDDASKKRVARDLEGIDVLLSSQIVNLKPEDLVHLIRLPDSLGRLGLVLSRGALLYTLGHEKLLRDEQFIPKDQTAQQIAGLFGELASQTDLANLSRPLILNDSSELSLATKAQGIWFHVKHQSSLASILAAEVIIGAVEVIFTTTVDLGVAAHTERFDIVVQESNEDKSPEFEILLNQMSAIVRWPAGLIPATYAMQGTVHNMLIGLSTSILATTCYIPSPEKSLDTFIKNDSFFHRLSIVLIAGNSRSRVLGESVSRLEDWAKLSTKTFELEASYPQIARMKAPAEGGDRTVQDRDSRPAMPKDHREIGVGSVIDLPLWNQAGWTGVAFNWDSGQSPIMALVFANDAMAQLIFSRWRDRFTSNDEKEEIYLAIIKDISSEFPFHYNLVVTSSLPEKNEDLNKFISYTSRTHTMMPSSPSNLDNFLRAYKQVEGYIFMPAALKDGTLKLMPEFAIAKRQLVVKHAADIKANDIEAIGLGTDEYKRRFGAPSDI